MMKHGKSIYLALLMLTFVSAIAVLIRVNLRPKDNPINLSAFSFPQIAKLEDWQFQRSKPLKIPENAFPKPLAQRKYLFRREQLQLDVTMRYFSLENASMTLFIKEYTDIKSVPEIRYHPEVGFYGVGVENQLAYLSSCINPRGQATFTDAQFKQNRYQLDFQPARLMSWLIKDEPLLDRRCLWVHFSLPQQNISQQRAYEYLEAAWFDWYGFWKNKFPSP